MSFEPVYLRTWREGRLEPKVEQAVATLASCTVCPRDCHVNRFEDKRALCKTGRQAWVGSYFPHFGEEDCLRGWRGSGTIFFSHCNLKCVFCQNHEISQDGEGLAVKPDVLAGMMLQLQARGCHNINLVTPEHVVPQVLEALVRAVAGGLRLPIVYNTSGYDAPESLALMDGVVDIYMPDFKYWTGDLAFRFLKARDYPEIARAAIREMHRQVGDLVMDAGGLAQRGLLVRHLVMPGGLDETRAILRWLRALSPQVYVNLMDQYRPDGQVLSGRYPELDRRLTADEFARALAIAREEGVYRLDSRQRESVIR